MASAGKKKRESAAERYQRMRRIEDELHEQGYLYVAGIDEAGRGPLAGPVYAAAVILDPEEEIIGLNDSKKLSEKKREALAVTIRAKALAWAICAQGPERIDAVNILEATKAAMTEAVKHLKLRPDFLLTDAVKLPAFPPEQQRSLIQGDARCNAVAAASVAN